MEVLEQRFEQENLKAEEHISKGNLPPAAGILVDIVERDPQNWRAFNNMGIISWMQHAWNDAYVMFKKSVSLKPDYTDALINLFDAALKLRRIPDITDDFRRALEADPGREEIRVLLESIEQEGEGIYLSERAAMVGRYDPLINEANELLEAGKINEALAKYLEANDVQGPSAEAFTGLGIVSYYQKRYADAFTLFVESIKLNPADKDTFLNLLDAAKNCDRVNDARKVFELYVKEYPFLEALAPEFDKAV